MRARHRKQEPGVRVVDGNEIPAFFLYGEPLRPPDERLIHIETIAARSALHDWNIRPHRHRDFHQLILTRHGEFTARIDDATSTLRSPAAVVVTPGCVHAFEFEPATVGIVISFAAHALKGLLDEGSAVLKLLERSTAATLGAAPFKATDSGLLGEMLLREFKRSAPGRQAALRGLLGALLANLLRLLGDPGDASSGPMRQRELVACFRRLIEVRYQSHDAVSAVARQLGVSEARLRRACLSVAGQSPGELMHLRLLVEAERQLRYTSMSIAQVAHHLGFEDPAYFTRFFTRRARKSPRAFRSECVE